MEEEEDSVTQAGTTAAQSSVLISFTCDTESRSVNAKKKKNLGIVLLPFAAADRQLAGRTR